MGISGGSNSITLPFLLTRSVPSLRLPVRRAPVSRLSRSGSAHGAHADFSRCGDQSVKLRREASKLDRPKRYQCELPLPATGQAKGDRRSCRRQFHFQQPLTPRCLGEDDAPAPINYQNPSHGSKTGIGDENGRREMQSADCCYFLFPRSCSNCEARITPDWIKVEAGAWHVTIHRCAPSSRPLQSEKKGSRDRKKQSAALGP